MVQERIGAPAGSYIHYGLTSSDVVDTALCATLTRAADLLLADLDAFVDALRTRALELMPVPVTGRTHGMHAEPTTFGAKFALWALQADRDRRRLRAARDAIAVGKLSGAVGTYSNVDPAVEARVCAALGLQAVPATQVIARDRHAEYFYACASIGATVELMCTEIRHLARSEVGEAEEPFRRRPEGQLGHAPQAQPDSLRAPLRPGPRCCAGYLGAGLEDVALWHERDISHSSVERVALPDASLLACYVLRKATGLASGLVIHADRARENLTNGSYGLVFSQSVLLALVSSGLTRDAAYRIVQHDARVAWAERRPFSDVLTEDPEMSLTEPQLDEAFDLTRSLRHTDRFRDALAALAHGSHPAQLHSGKVRELYDAGEERLVMVASDRVSAFDVIMAEPIADKGRVLTAMSVFWYDEMPTWRPVPCWPPTRTRYRLPCPGRACLPSGRVGPSWCAGPRCCRSSASSGATWPDRPMRSTSGRALCTARCMPAGLRDGGPPGRTHLHPVDQGGRRPRRQHQPGRGRGTWWAARRRRPPVTSASSSTPAPPPATADVGFILPTQVELGYVDGGAVLCATRSCTPDSSRLWPADQVVPGGHAAGLRQAALRDWLADQPWDRVAPPPPLPARVTKALSERYVAAYERVTGLSLGDWYGARR